MRIAVLLTFLVLVARPVRSAHAERSDTVRAIHAGGIATFGVGYLVVELKLKAKLVPDGCRHWCSPPRIDQGARETLVWNNTQRADTISDITGYYSAPIVSMGLLVASTADDPDARRWFDDVVPVLESAITVSTLHHVFKFIVGRQRPFVHYSTGDRDDQLDDNMSFWSGHTSLAFSLAVSAGVVAEQRGYKVAPYVWASGLTLATTTGLLRICADRHYFTDVVVGAIIGSAAGIAVPLLLHRDTLGDEPSMTARLSPLLSYGGVF
ncbi:MAG TPA: phosphatase PAP2 family protein [Kofleriaceae bacterium]|nr:phosphatase PAP2 family protein [Kofleriaceae bacterium]